MAIIKVKTGGRGRPLEIDVEKTLKQFKAQWDIAKERLKEFRRTTSGVRDTEILGTETLAPKSIGASIDVLEALREGGQINYKTAKELRENMRMVQRLASKQERVYGTALEGAISRQYTQEIKYQSEGASPTAQKLYNQMLEKVKQMDKAQRQKFYTSRYYQSVKTYLRQYQNVIEWAEAEGQVGLTGEEAQAYAEADKLEVFLTGKHLSGRPADKTPADWGK